MSEPSEKDSQGLLTRLPAPQQRPPLVLVVDDDQGMRLMLRHAMEPDGYTVEEAEDGKQGLSAYERLRPDIVLLDALLPGLDGFAVCARIKELPNSDRTPVLMITCLDDEKSVDRAFAVGASDYVTKPIHWAVLRQRVRHLLRTKQAEEILQQAYDELEIRVEERTAELSQANVLLKGEITERQRAEAALAAEKERLAVTLRSIGDGVITTDMEGRIVLLNTEAENLTGWSLAEAEGKPLPEIFHIIHKQTRAIAENPVGKVLKNGGIAGLTDHTALIARDGTERLISASSAPIWDYAGNIMGVVVAFRDITERKLAQEQLQQRIEQLQAIYHLSNAVSAAEAIEEVYQEAMNSLQRTLKADRSSVLLLDPDGVMRFKAWRGLSERYRMAVEGHTPWSPSEKNPQPVLVTDVEEEPGLERLRALIIGEDIHALGFIPLVYKERLLGKFMIYYSTPHVFSAEEVQLAQTIASDVAFAIARRQAEEALADEKERLAVTLRSIADGVITTDMEGKIVLLNKVANRLTGWSEENAIGKPLGEVFHIVNEKTRELCKNPVEKVLTTGGIDFVNHTALIARDDTERIIAYNGAPIRDKNGNIIGVVLVFSDITEKQKIEAELQKASLLEKEVSVLRRKLEDRESLEAMMGKSQAIKALYASIERVAATKFTVLIQGESGTGKEIVARAIHDLSPVCKNPFVAVDCGSIPDTLVESELFGYEKGAFTGADRRKEGLFEVADTGTIFLDEIGNLPLSAQQKLLRVIQERRLHRLGAKVSNKIEVRIIAAANSSLKAKVDSGEFRADLYYRLNEFIITIPPLRARKEDILFLAQKFMHEAQQDLGKVVEGMSEGFAKGLLQRSWRGNVRELKNVVRRAVLLCDRTLEAQHLIFDDAIVETLSGGEFVPNPQEGRALREMTREVTARMEQEVIRKALKMNRGNKSKVAQQLGIDYKTLLKKIKYYGIRIMEWTP